MVYGAVGALLIALAGHKVADRASEPRQVRFVRPAPRPVAPPPPPPPPPPRAAKRKAKVAGNAPSIPKELSAERLAEADERDFRSLLGTLGTAAAVELGGALERLGPPPAPAATCGPARRARAPRGRRSRPVREPRQAGGGLPGERAQAGRRRASSCSASWSPRTVRSATSRCVVGQEPFVAAALAAVREWTYRPASIDGKPIALHREIRLPFRLRSRA